MNQEASTTLENEAKRRLLEVFTKTNLRSQLLSYKFLKVQFFFNAFCQKQDKIQQCFYYKYFYYQVSVQQFQMGLRKAAKYAKISLNRRLKLIEMISRPNTSISKAARTLGLKPSTAKLIVKRYKEEGTFFESKNNRAKRLKRLQAQEGAHLQQQVIEEVDRNEANPLENYSSQGLQWQLSLQAPWTPILMWSAELQTYYWMMPYQSFGALQ